MTTKPEADRVYFAEDNTRPGVFIAVLHGRTGYYPATVYTQEHADSLNKAQGITPAQVRAAVACSMFDCWQNFDRLANED